MNIDSSAQSNIQTRRHGWLSTARGRRAGRAAAARAAARTARRPRPAPLHGREELVPRDRATEGAVQPAPRPRPACRELSAQEHRAGAAAPQRPGSDPHHIHFLTETKAVALSQPPWLPATTTPSHLQGAGFSGASLWFGLSHGK